MKKILKEMSQNKENNKDENLTEPHDVFAKQGGKHMPVKRPLVVADVC